MAAKLYDLELSGNCYKVRLLAALLGVPLDVVPVDFLGGAHKKPPLVDLNAFGEIPILEDGGLVLRDSQAILIYLARKWGGESWLPTDAAGLALVTSWLMVAESEIARGPNDARLHDKFGYKLDVEAARSKAVHVVELWKNAWPAALGWRSTASPSRTSHACRMSRLATKAAFRLMGIRRLWPGSSG